MNTAYKQGKRVIAFRLIVSVIWLCLPVFLLSQTKPKYNVLFIALDDMSERASVFGYPEVFTPNLQRLADRGVVFKRAYCQFPLCSPSRTSLLSGWRPDKTRIFDNGTRPRSVMGPGVKFLPEYFSLHGYHTERVGKIMHGDFEDDIKWDYPKNNSDSFTNNIDAASEIVAETGENNVPGTWWVRNVPDDSIGNRRLANKMVHRMQLSRAKPFFFAFGFTVHNPFTPSLKYWNMYGDSSTKQVLPIDVGGTLSKFKGNGSANIVLPKTPPNDRADVPEIAFPVQVQKTTEEWKNTVHAYFAEVTEMDAQLGLVLDELDNQNLWDSTVVIFWSDHGQHLGEHEGTWLKNTLFEESDRVPLIVCAPGKTKGISHALVELVDIFPTLTDLCGLPLPDGLEGTSFVPVLDDKKITWKRAVFTQVLRDTITCRSITTKQYRYNSWGANGSELYYRTNDPFEYTNLVSDTAYAATLKKMRWMLAEGWTKSLPPSNAAKANVVNDNNDLFDNGVRNTAPNIKVYPNPSNGKISVLLNSFSATSAYITVYDNSGNIVFQTTVGVNKGINRLGLTLPYLAVGVYSLVCRSGGKIERAKIIIDR